MPYTHVWQFNMHTWKNCSVLLYLCTGKISHVNIKGGLYLSSWLLCAPWCVSIPAFFFHNPSLSSLSVKTIFPKLKQTKINNSSVRAIASNSELCFLCILLATSGYNIKLLLLLPLIPGNKLIQKDNADSGVQFITPADPRQSPRSQGPWPIYVKTLYTLSERAQTHLPKLTETSLNKGKERYNQS